MGPRRHELIKIGGELVTQHLRGPYAEQVRNALSGWRDPRAKALRRRRKAVRRTKLWAGTGVTTGAGAVVVDVAVANPGGGVAVLIGAAVVSGVAAISSGVSTWRLHREPLPEPVAAPVALPGRGSAAREPMRRLTEAEDTLREALTQLSRAALVPPDAVTEARETGAEAATALRAVAARLQVVERAREHAPPLERGHLTESVRRLAAQVDEGLDGYGALVAAAAHALAASSTAAPTHALTDATDRLAALASALRDLTQP
ncbi:hypothetical protein [Actinokineospora sp. NBRC 105648]|uniref:phage shock envelope stress response protein PspM n=1 Tax=Actinokineospora sp. NBRC 105648 TaxID=3032206 RepID=UPI0024A38823|nr:hypothetical protein [Actinokineospora sp. NBRC 105648]GLZ40162.1 hypothetical protein Acsp05_37860 [Actinokineospora sp. NBRC 105648]